MTKRRVFISILFAFLLYETTAESRKLPLKVFYTDNKSLTVNEIQDDFFIPADKVDSFHQKKTCWIELKIPEYAVYEESSVISFSTERFYFGEAYIKNSENRWRYYQNLGLNAQSETSLLSYKNHSILISRESFVPGMEFRIKIMATHPSIIETRLQSLEKTVFQNQKLALYYGYLFGACILLSLFLFYTFRTFQQTDAWYLTLAFFDMLLFISLKTGVFDKIPLLNNETIHRFAFPEMIFFIFCANRSLKCVNEPVFQKFPARLKKILIFSPVSVISSVFLIILYLVVPLPEIFLQIIPLIAMYISASVFYITGFYTLKLNQFVRHTYIWSWISAITLFLVKQTFLVLRFYFKDAFFLNGFNNDLAIPEFLMILAVALFSLHNMHHRIKSQMAANQIQEENLKIQEQNLERRDEIFVNFSQMILNPVQKILSITEQNKEQLPKAVFSEISSGTKKASQVLKTLSLLSFYKNSRTEVKMEKEQISLKSFFDNSFQEELTNLRLNNCYLNIIQNFSPRTAVLADRHLLTLLFKYILQTVNNAVTPGKTVTISSEYQNYTLIFSVHFYSKPVSPEETKSILKIDAEDETEENRRTFRNLTKIWGTEVFAARLILEYLHGAITITPDFDGNTISVRLAMEGVPFPLLEEDYSYLEDSDETENSPETVDEEQTEKSGTICILEQDESVRNLLVRLFKKNFRTIALSNGNQFLEHLENETPDLVICSLMLPGKNAFELLDMRSKFPSTPFIVMTEIATSRTYHELYEKGAVDIVEKPFDSSLLAEKVVSYLAVRKNQNEEILRKINSTLSRSVFENKTMEIPQPEKIVPVPEQENIPSAGTDSSFLALCISAKLTKKETAIALQIVKNKTDKEIAAELNIAPATVAVHNKKIFKKLNVHSRSELSKLSKN